MMIIDRFRQLEMCKQNCTLHKTVHCLEITEIDLLCLIQWHKTQQLILHCYETLFEQKAKLAVR